MKRLIITLLSSTLIAGTGVSIVSAETRPNQIKDDFYWFQNVQFTPNGEDGVDYGTSLAIVSASSYFDKSTNQGRERGRIWARPNNAKKFLQADGSIIIGEVEVPNAILQFQSRWWDGILNIDDTIPMETTESKVEIPPIVYDIFGAVDKYWAQVASTIIGKIDGFVYAKITAKFPDAWTDWAHYMEYYDLAGLDNIALPDQYTYVEADTASNNLYNGASGRWDYHLDDRSAYSYDVSVVGRVLYRAESVDPVGGYSYTDWGWSDTVWTNHQVNKP